MHETRDHTVLSRISGMGGEKCSEAAVTFQLLCSNCMELVMRLAAPVHIHRPHYSLGVQLSEALKFEF